METNFVAYENADLQKQYEDYCLLRTDLELMLSAYDRKLMTWQKIRRNLRKFLDEHSTLESIETEVAET